MLYQLSYTPRPWQRVKAGQGGNQGSIDAVLAFRRGRGKAGSGQDGGDMDSAARSGWDEVFKGDPWRGLPAEALDRARAVPTMLTPAEARLYHWIGRHARGQGATVDLGAFAGGSAARLLSGLERCGQDYHLHAYDRFTASPQTRARHLTPAGVAPSDDPDILPLVQAHLAPWADRVTLVRGDIRDQRWTGGPVEILAVDAGKTPDLADHIAAEFFPALIPGGSVVIQQDFLHASLPWLAVQMQALAAQFRPLAFAPADTVVFLCTARPGPADLARARTEGLSDAELIAGLRAAADWLAPLVPRARFDAMARKLRANPGVRIGWKMRRS